MNISKVLVIGAEGQLGVEFKDLLSNKDIDHFAPKEKECDVTNADQLKNIFSEYAPEIVINCAAYNSVDAAEEDSSLAYLINREAVENIAVLCREYKSRLVHYGTDYVFDGNKQDLYYESDEPNPLTIFGKSKLAGEEAVLECDPEFLVFRLSWVIGRGSQNFLYKLNNWALKNSVLKISADEVSIPTFTPDVVEFTLLALEKGLSGLYHMTSTDYASRYELARYYAKLVNLDNIILPVPMSQFETKATRPVFSAMSNKKLAKELKIAIPTWQDSMEKFLTI